jgi:CRISPR system Cascade subunit CasD
MTRPRASLALCFDAPMQSWGIRSRGVIRETTTEPTKSGVVGVLAAALGTARDDEKTIGELAALDLAVRVDREGILERDYHTTRNVPTTRGTGHRTVVSERYYLADALFLVVLQGDADLLHAVRDALESPQWPLFFGRRAFVPARPLVTRTGLTDIPAGHVLESHDWLENDPDVRETERAKPLKVALRTVRDCPLGTLGAEVGHDHPVTFAAGNRRYRTRTVIRGEVRLTDDLIHPAGDQTPCS